MKIAVIGAGNIGGAIIRGAVKGGKIKAENITITDLNPGIVKKFTKDDILINYTRDNKEAIKGVDWIFIAVKPWQIESVLGEIAELVDRTQQTIVSCAAGISFEQLVVYLKSEQYGKASIYRVIPNTAASIGKSVSFISSYNTSAEKNSVMADFFGALGEVFEIDESLMSAGTALASSGIAYAYRYIEAAMKGGKQMGFDTDTALKIVLATVEGAVTMLQTSGLTPEQEINKVTTPGGVTLKGLETMEKGGFTQAVIDGLIKTI